MSDSTVTPDVIVSTVGGAGVITLNRPKALNSLNQAMCLAIEAALDQWRDDPAIHQVVIASASPKAFCAGGDVRAIREAQQAGRHDLAEQFFLEEYRMDAAIATYPKPIVALVDGINMGGGMGLSLHAQYRIYSEKAWASMPEAAIGFVPDVGVTWAAQRVVGTIGRPAPEIATFMGITGFRAKLADALYCGIATHFVPSDHMSGLIDGIGADGVAAALGQWAAEPPAETGFLEQHIADISRVFSRDTWAEMEQELAAPETNPEFAAAVKELTANASPASLVAIAELYRANRNAPDVQAGINNEYDLGKVLREEPNFAEGVRAVLVDKTQDAKFEPARTADVDVEPYRAALTWY
ncbi:enoyl-CoA hydratase/isomerase family protein [Corynebacterium ulceribovis]|uniref:enoyl-CoA hydratase/isomerase family protein n=1 Tax=Corynebacterium ulceribovis TaxID=487732 RepID=UPI00039AD05F|nr:enoyl-CoA hydratase/isomerase family protein [Corynebacterium ulceribovis]